VVHPRHARPVSTLVFYISGHGFGHASRAIEILNAVGLRDRSRRLVVCTSAPRWLFDLTMRVPFDFREIETDTGVIQRDSLSHDVAETLRRLAAFHQDFDARVRREADFLRGMQAALVLADIPPLACAAAARAGVPAVGIGNFTWDWIYEEYDEVERVAPGAVSSIRGAYAEAVEAWRLPMHGGFEAFRHVADVPFVARRSQRDPLETRRAFGIPADRRVVLSSFGGYGLRGLPLEHLDMLEDYTVLVTETSARDAPAGSHASVVALEEDDIYGRGFRYEDLVRAADVVITKPGFGIIAECLANDTALVYTSRGRFREYDVLVGEMPQFLRCAFISQEDVFAGRWRAALDAALARPAPPTRPSTEGAQVIAEAIARAPWL
jgi:hypothetical protein